MRPSEKVPILLVDDRPEGLLALEAVLSTAGRNYFLVKASSGAEALLALAERDFAVVLLDVQMPEMDGFETAQRIRQVETWKNLPIIFVTAINKDDSHIYRGYESGAVDYLFKPFDPLVLQSKVQFFADLFLKEHQIRRQERLLKDVERKEKERQLAEMELESLRRYRSLADAIPHLVLKASSDGIVEYVNENWIRYTGLSMEKSAGIGWRSAIEESDLPALMDAWRNAIRGGHASIEAECRIRGKGGMASRWYLVRLAAEKGADGRLNSWIGTCTDIHDRKLVEQERVSILEREREARFNAERAQGRLAFIAEAGSILSGSFDYQSTLAQVARLALPLVAEYFLVDIVGEDGVVRREVAVHANSLMEELVQKLRAYPPSADDASGVGRVIRTGDTVLIGQMNEADVDAVFGDGAPPELCRQLGPRSCVIVPLRVRDRVLGALTLVRATSGRAYTRSDLKLAQDLAYRAALAIENARLYKSSREALRVLQEKTRALEMSNHDLEQFAYVASHDLQEPLRKVASYVDILNRYHKDSLTPESERYTAHIIDGVMRMQSLIHGLLAYSRVDREAQKIAPAECDTVVSEVLADFQPIIKECGASVVVDPLPVVVADRTQLAQLFQNLIGNALKFRNGDPPQIHIGAERRGKEWIFSVKDNGVGVDPAFADRIFVIFQRLHSRDAYPGTGIGLAICKKIVERHGGRIWVESQGKGASFFFTLPEANVASLTSVPS